MQLCSFRDLSVTLLMMLSSLCSLPSQAIDATSHLPSRISQVKADGRPLQLLGAPLTSGDSVADFKAANSQFELVQGAQYQGRYLMLLTVPSLDTELGQQLLTDFVTQTSHLPTQVVRLVITTDLPFVQTRIASSFELGQVQLLSDAIWGDVGIRFGVRIKDMGLLTTALFLLGPDGTLLHQDLPINVAGSPDYAAAIQQMPLVAEPKSSKAAN